MPRRSNNWTHIKRKKFRISNSKTTKRSKKCQKSENVLSSTSMSDIEENISFNNSVLGVKVLSSELSHRQSSTETHNANLHLISTPFHDQSPEFFNEIKTVKIKSEGPEEDIKTIQTKPTEFKTVKINSEVIERAIKKEPIEQFEKVLSTSNALLPAFGFLDIQKVTSAEPIKIKKEPPDFTIDTSSAITKTREDCEIIAAINPVKIFKVFNDNLMNCNDDVIVVSESVMSKEVKENFTFDSVVIKNEEPCPQTNNTTMSSPIVEGIHNIMIDRDPLTKLLNFKTREERRQEENNVSENFDSALESQKLNINEMNISYHTMTNQNLCSTVNQTEVSKDIKADKFTELIKKADHIMKHFKCIQEKIAQKKDFSESGSCVKIADKQCSPLNKVIKDNEAGRLTDLLKKADHVMKYLNCIQEQIIERKDVFSESKSSVKIVDKQWNPSNVRICNDDTNEDNLKFLEISKVNVDVEDSSSNKTRFFELSSKNSTISLNSNNSLDVIPSNPHNISEGQLNLPYNTQSYALDQTQQNSQSQNPKRQFSQDEQLSNGIKKKRKINLKKYFKRKSAVVNKEFNKFRSQQTSSENEIVSKEYLACNRRTESGLMSVKNKDMCMINTTINYFNVRLPDEQTASSIQIDNIKPSRFPNSNNCKSLSNTDVLKNDDQNHCASYCNNRIVCANYPDKTNSCNVSTNLPKTPLLPKPSYGFNLEKSSASRFRSTPNYGTSHSRGKPLLSDPCLDKAFSYFPNQLSSNNYPDALNLNTFVPYQNAPHINNQHNSCHIVVNSDRTVDTFLPNEENSHNLVPRNIERNQFHSHPSFHISPSDISSKPALLPTPNAKYSYLKCKGSLLPKSCFITSSFPNPLSEYNFTSETNPLVTKSVSNTTLNNLGNMNYSPNCSNKTEHSFLSNEVSKSNLSDSTSHKVGKEKGARLTLLPTPKKSDSNFKRSRPLLPDPCLSASSFNNLIDPFDMKNLPNLFYSNDVPSSYKTIQSSQNYRSWPTGRCYDNPCYTPSSTITNTRSTKDRRIPLLPSPPPSHKIVWTRLKKRRKRYTATQNTNF